MSRNKGVVWSWESTKASIFRRSNFIHMRLPYACGAQAANTIPHFLPLSLLGDKRLNCWVLPLSSASLVRNPACRKKQ